MAAVDLAAAEAADSVAAVAGFTAEAQAVEAPKAAEVTGNGIVHEDSNFRYGERNHAR